MVGSRELSKRRVRPSTQTHVSLTGLRRDGIAVEVDHDPDYDAEHDYTQNHGTPRAKKAHNTPLSESGAQVSHCATTRKGLVPGFVRNVWYIVHPTSTLGIRATAEQQPVAQTAPLAHVAKSQTSHAPTW